MLRMTWSVPAFAQPHGELSVESSAGRWFLVVSASAAREATHAMSSTAWKRIELALALDKMLGLGARVGVGDASARIAWLTKPAVEVECRWSTAAKPEPLASAPASMRERLTLLFELVEATRRGTVDELVARLPEPRRDAIVTSNAHGRLLVRFWVCSAHDASEEDRGTWWKLYDSGVLERRRRANEDDDGDVGEVVPALVDAARAQAIAALARRTLELRGDDTDYAWQAYDEDGRCVGTFRASISHDMGGPGYSVAPLLYDLNVLLLAARS
jgi:hypothetical protein